MKCNKCNKIKDDSQFYRPGRVCRECKNAYQRKLRQRPDIKEKHRIDQKKWREKNRAAALAISQRAYYKNAEKYNSIRRKKYKNDPEYRQKKLDCEAKYKATGRRKELRVKHAPTLRKRASDWKKENKEWVKKYVRKYKDRYWIAHQREQREKLDDAYVICVIKKWSDYQLKTKDIPKELIEIYRQRIIIKRSLKHYL